MDEFVVDEFVVVELVDVANEEDEDEKILSSLYMPQAAPTIQLFLLAVLLPAVAADADVDAPDPVEEGLNGKI
uniref:Uncharacterized protein n=1 Tax=Panagrolaimus sp. ES5 TaxID=591445 RepID=A0AC34G2R6_9BILA